MRMSRRPHLSVRVAHELLNGDPHIIQRKLLGSKAVSSAHVSCCGPRRTAAVRRQQAGPLLVATLPTLVTG